MPQNLRRTIQVFFLLVLIAIVFIETIYAQKQKTKPKQKPSQSQTKDSKQATDADIEKPDSIGLVMIQAGNVKNISSEKVEHQYNNGETRSFIINNRTKFCVNGYQVNSWRELANAKVVTVMAGVESRTAVEVHYGAISLRFSMSTMGTSPEMPSCKPPPKTAKEYVSRGDAYRNGEKEDLDLAIQDYNRAILLDPKDAGAYNSLGSAHFKKGDLDFAIQDYGKTILLDPRNATAYQNRAKSYRALGKNDLADADEKKAQELKEAITYFNRGNVYYEKRDLDRAIQDYNQAILLDPNYTEAYINRGIAYWKKRDLDRAIQDYNQAISLNPKGLWLTWAYVFRALAYEDKGDFDRAFRDYNKLISLNPKRSGSYGVRGNAYFRKGDLDLAIQDYNRAISLDPKNAQAYKDRSKAYRALGKNDLADADEKKAKELSEQKR
jgi:tetratricopeptide (TPR) repeat protein